MISAPDSAGTLFAAIFSPVVSISKQSTSSLISTSQKWQKLTFIGLVVVEGEIHSMLVLDVILWVTISDGLRVESVPNFWMGCPHVIIHCHGTDKTAAFLFHPITMHVESPVLHISPLLHLHRNNDFVILQLNIFIHKIILRMKYPSTLE